MPPALAPALWRWTAVLGLVGGTVPGARAQSCAVNTESNATVAEQAFCLRGMAEAPCYDPVACPRAPNAVDNGRHAFVVSFDCHGPFDVTKYAMYLRKWAQQAKREDADLVMLVPEPRLRPPHPLGPGQRQMLTTMGVTLVEVPWIIPPNLSPKVPVESGGCCGAREFMKLHAFGLVQYSAVLYLDLDTFPAPGADFRRFFACASAGHFFSTRGNWTPLNAAFMAFPPNATTLQYILGVLSRSEVDHACGWNRQGWGPVHSKFDARVQGFMWHLLYQRGPPSSVHSTTGMWPEQVNPCVYNMKRGTNKKICIPMLCSKPGITQSFHKSNTAPTPAECHVWRNGKTGPPPAAAMRRW